jgi:hypothetical protein
MPIDIAPPPHAERQRPKVVLTLALFAIALFVGLVLLFIVAAHADAAGGCGGG